MKLISVREHPEYAEEAIACFQKWWGSPTNHMVYEDCIQHCLTAEAALPQWYLLFDGASVAGGAGLVTNDFISRMDLFPWLCAVYIEEAHRGNCYSRLLIERAQQDAKRAGFSHLYLCTDHVGFYEKFGFSYLGQGYHPWGEQSRIYEW